MAHNALDWLDAPIINLDTTDSTNNDAMRLIDADTAQPGTTIVTAYQSAGRGQRGNSWLGGPGESLMMSVITVPPFSIEQQFAFSALVATTIATCLQKLDDQLQIQIKWPNDIIVNDKKAGGILIENVLRGHSWLYAVIGFGLNVLQDDFGAELPHATSLKAASGRAFDINRLAKDIRSALIEQILAAPPISAIIDRYNGLLFRKDAPQAFCRDGERWMVMVRKVLANGQLEAALEDGATVVYTHGEVRWMY